MLESSGSSGDGDLFQTFQFLRLYFYVSCLLFGIKSVHTQVQLNIT